MKKTHNENKMKRSLFSVVMILTLTGQLWPAGEIDLFGLP
jgi:hypothetical protein